MIIRRSILALVLTTTSVEGQVQWRGGVGRDIRAPGFSIARDREAEAWLKKAVDARDAADWKLLADTLYRLVDEHSGSTVADPRLRRIWRVRAATAARIEPGHGTLVVRRR